MGFQAASGTSEWFYVWLAYGLTWVSLAGYALYLRGRVRRGEAAERRAER